MNTIESIQTCVCLWFRGSFCDSLCRRPRTKGVGLFHALKVSYTIKIYSSESFWFSEYLHTM